MNAQDAIKNFVETGEMIGQAYLGDLTDKELFHRPAPACNHINWQLGHLIVSENHMIGKLAGSRVPPLPPGFAEKYTPETSKKDDPKDFCSKAELLRVHQEQRAATLATLANLSAEDLDKPSGIEFAPTVGAALAVQGGHWLMHSGQWAVIRRQLGRPPLF